MSGLRTKWAELPTSARVGILVLVVAITSLPAGLVFRWIDSIAMKSQPVIDALALATNSPAVRSKLGEGIIVSGRAIGHLRDSDVGGEAEYVIPVKGPLGRAELGLRASRGYGSWTFSELVVRCEDGTVLDLLNETPSSGPESR